MIKTEKLCKTFGEIKAVNEVSLTITDNSIFGLAGTNGAGKSTLLRILAGVLRQDSGKILVDGQEVYENPACKRRFSFCRIPPISSKTAASAIWPDIFPCTIRDTMLPVWKSWQTNWDWKKRGKSVRFPRV